MDELIRSFSERGDLAHLALIAWALGASGAFAITLRALVASMRRFDDFVRELALFNQRAGGRD